MSVARVPHKLSFYTLIYGQILGVLTLRRKAGNSDIECIRAYIWGSEHLFEAFYPVYEVLEEWFCHCNNFSFDGMASRFGTARPSDGS